MSEISPAEKVFFAALEKSSEAERSAYLDTACAEDPGLRARVDRLLAAHFRAENPTGGETIDESVPPATEAGQETQLVSSATVSPFSAEETCIATELATVGHTLFPSEARDVERAPVVRPGESVAGRVIAGRYTLREVLGEGGMGTVYRADQIEPVKRQVALKLIKIGMDSRAVLARFDAERQALALMDHPNIARVYDGGTTEAGQPFFVMELIQGVPITEYCDLKRLPVRSRLELFVAVCQAVQHAHHKGIIHRDIKPSNVLVTEVDGRPTPKVIDFGVAKAVEFNLTDQSLADTGAIVGTPTYMSPEQADPSSMDIDTRTDVYALGVILYKMLAGSPPIEAKQFKRMAIYEMLRMVREVDPPSPSTKVSTSEALPSIAATRDINPDQLKRALQGDLDWVVMKALEKDRTRRYETANGFAADLMRHLANEPVLAAPPSRVYRLRKFVRKNRGAVIAASLVLFTLLAGIVGTALGLIRAEHQRVEAELARQREGTESTARTTAEKARDAVAEARDRLASVEYGRTMEVVHQEWRDSNVATSLNLLNATPKDLRGWEWRYVNRLCHLDLLTLKGHTDGVSSAGFSPDGTRIVTASWDNTAKVWDARNGAEVLTLMGHTDGVFSAGVRSASFSPDGARIVTAGADGTAKVWDARSGAEVLTLKGHAFGVRLARFSPDGSRIVAAGGDNTAKVWEVTSGGEVLTLEGHTSEITSASFSPDGTRIVTASGDRTAKLWDARSGAVVLTLKGHTSDISSVSFSPDGLRIVTASFDSTAKVWDARSGAEVLTLKGHTGRVTSAGFRPDGLGIVTASFDTTAKVWDARSGAEVRTLKGNTGVVTSVGFSPDGSRVVTASGDTANVWDAHSGADVLTLKGNIGGLTSACFSPDGSRIVIAGGGNTARVCDATSGSEVLTLEGHAGSVISASFSPDGSRVVTGTDDSTAQVWDARSGAEVLTLKGHTGIVLPADILPADMLVGDIPFDGVNAASFSPAGTRVVTAGGDHTAKVWDARNGAEVLTLKGHAFGVTFACFSPDGTRIVTAGEDSTAKVWDARSGVEVLTLKGHTSIVRSTRFSPDGSRVVTASYDGTAKVWDARNGVEVFTLKGHAGGVTSAGFSPDGSRIVTASYDSTVKVWDARTGAEVLTLKGHTGPIHSASFSRDGSRIVTAGGDGTAKIWDARPITRDSLTP